MKESTRSFIAISRITEPLLHEISTWTQKQITKYEVGFKWVKTENIHLTLRFLGDITPDQMGCISQTLDKHCKGVQPFKIVVVGIGAFPSLNHPRTLWAGVQSDFEFHALISQLDAEITKLGIRFDDRPFSPHLTLCRVSDHAEKNTLLRLATDLRSVQNHAFGVTRVNGITLFKSQWSAQGPVYTSISTHPFQRQP
ncbi:MAG: RNA 2',3'-cyclic phosphodiesterase [Chloroflexi bacterium]|nr:RNA 2',3'-cyclic phosphodiesterase [Chloroflexota bacterium]